MDNKISAPDEQFCSSCGNVVKKAAEICPHCGVRRFPPPAPVVPPPVNGKEWLVALLLCIFLGGMGVHRFYTGHILIGVLQLMTCGMCGIWQLIDVILLVTDSYRDADGKPLIKR
jgi:hypothetical protein